MDCLANLWYCYKNKIYVRSTDEDDPTSAYGTFDTSDGTVYDSLSEAMAAISNSYKHPPDIIFLPGTHNFSNYVAFTKNYVGMSIRGLSPEYRDLTVLNFTLEKSTDYLLYFSHSWSTTGLRYSIKDIKICVKSSYSIDAVVYFHDYDNNNVYVIDNVYIDATDADEYIDRFVYCNVVNLKSVDMTQTLDVKNCIFEGTPNTSDVYLSSNNSYSFKMFGRFYGNITIDRTFSYSTSGMDSATLYINSYDNS